ncbi:unnamed protein product, partial [Arabis nemorensis]
MSFYDVASMFGNEISGLVPTNRTNLFVLHAHLRVKINLNRPLPPKPPDPPDPPDPHLHLEPTRSISRYFASVNFNPFASLVVVASLAAPTIFPRCYHRRHLVTDSATTGVVANPTNLPIGFPFIDNITCYLGELGLAHSVD